LDILRRINAKKLLEEKEIEYTYRDLGEVNTADVNALQKIAGAPFRTVPQIFKYKVGGGLDYIGGFTELKASLNPG
jgi:glutaredoxin